MTVAIKVFTSSVDKLRDELNKKIEDGDIETWEVDQDGDFTHSREQWRCKAWIHKPVIPNNEDNQLIFGLVGNKQVSMTKALYAVYHGRFSEMLLSHFDDIIEKIEITSQKTEYDYFS